MDAIEKSVTHIGPTVPVFLRGGGQMGALIRAHMWRDSPLGPPQDWSLPLLTTVRTLLGSKVPMLVAWGPDLRVLYNDSYAPLLNDRHCDALGDPLAQVWDEIWSNVRPFVDGALAGETTGADNLPIVIPGGGLEEQRYFSFSCSPVYDQTETVGGILVISVETTGDVLADRRLNFRIALKDRLRDLDDPREVMFAAAETLGLHLRADRVGYAEIEADTMFFVESDWCDAGMPSLAGRHRLDDFGPALIAEFRAGNTVAFADALTEPLTSGEDVAEAFRSVSTCAAMNVPLVKNGSLAGVLYVHGREPRHWTESEKGLVREVAESTWAEVQRARSESALRENHRRQDLLLRLLEGQRKTHDDQVMMQAAAEAVGRHLVVDRVGFFEMAEDDTLQFLSGWPGGRLPLLTVPLPSIGIGTGYLAEVRAGKTLGISDTRADPLTADSLFGEIGTVSLIGAPIIREGRWQAGLYVNHAEARAWTDGEIGLVREVADQTWDAVERARAERALQGSDARLHLALDAGRIGAWSLDIGRDSADRTPRHDAIFGYETPVAEWSFKRFLDHVLPEERDRVQSCFQSAVEGQTEWHLECGIERADGARRQIEVSGRPQRDAAGTVIGFIGVVIDITEARHAEERQALLVRELHHRVKNNLATVQSIINFTLRTSESMETFQAGIGNRIGALARSHTLLTDNEWDGAELEHILRAELEPYDDGGRLQLEGPRFFLPADAAVPLAMAVHELTTNAAKYGALSVEEGRLDIRWMTETAQEGRKLSLDWIERDGPPVALPTRRGFGTTLLERLLGRQLAGGVEIKYLPQGVQVRIEALIQNS